MLDGDRRELEDLDAALFGGEPAAPPAREEAAAPTAPVADDVDLDAALFGGGEAGAVTPAVPTPEPVVRPPRRDETAGPDALEALLGAPVPVAAATRAEQRSQQREVRRPGRRMAVVGSGAALVIALAVSVTVVFSRETSEVTTPRSKTTQAPVSTRVTSTTTRASTTTAAASSTTATTGEPAVVAPAKATTTTAPRRNANAAPPPVVDDAPQPGPDPTPPPPPPPPPPTDPPTTTTEPPTTTTTTTTTTLPPEPPPDTLP